MATFTITRMLNSPADKVWSIIGNFKVAPGAAIKIVMKDEGKPDENDVGAVRAITIGRFCLHERLESTNPPISFSYKLLSGAPVKNFQGEVEVKKMGGTTQLIWKVIFEPKFPGTGWIVRFVSMRTINRYLDAVESTLH